MLISPRIIRTITESLNILQKSTNRCIGHFGVQLLYGCRKKHGPLWTSVNPGLFVPDYSSRQPGGCGLSWPEITVIKTDNIIVFQV
ncbi:hypothetical protein, partial [Escherichia coli]